MGKRNRSTRTTTSLRPTSRAADPVDASLPAPRSWLNSRLVRYSILWSVAILVTLVVIRTLDLRLGQGSFAYRFSPVYSTRFFRGLPLLLLGLGLIGSLYLLVRQRARAGRMVFAVVALLMALWAWWAPPSPARQHMFNLISPAQDGAFVLERDSEIPDGASLRVYLRNFDQSLSRTVEEMRGTRVLSNPPGMTILATWVHRLWPPQVDPPGVVERSMGDVESFRDRPVLADAVRFAIVLHALWALALIPAYAVARLYLPPGGAMVSSLLMWLTPSSLLFTPGKDPAQLLTILTMLWAALASYQSTSSARAMLLAGVSGMMLVMGSMIGLIHLWVALAIVVALLWHTLRSEHRGAIWQLLLRQALPAGCGAILLILIVAWTTGWNIPATAIAVFHRFRQIQPTIALNHTLWMLIGLPIFLLFISAATFTVFMLNASRLKRGSGFGRKLLISTLAVMTLTYFMGVPYELPRLWVVFLPLLTLGITIDLPIFQAERSPRRTLPALALIIAIHLLFLVAHYSLLDVRESEYRMLTRRLWF